MKEEILPLSSGSDLSSMNINTRFGDFEFQTLPTGLSNVFSSRGSFSDSIPEPINLHNGVLHPNNIHYSFIQKNFPQLTTNQYPNKDTANAPNSFGGYGTQNEPLQNFDFNNQNRPQFSSHNNFVRTTFQHNN